MPGENGKKIIQHYLYSGLGGPGGVFFSLVEADKQQEFGYRAIFCGIEPLREEYRSKCEQFRIPYAYLQKKRGMDLAAYFKVFKLFRQNKPDIVFLHGVSFSIVPAFWYKLTRPRVKIIVRDTQAHHLKTRTEWFWMFFCLLLSKRMVYLTAESANLVRKKFGWWARRSKTVIIPNGLKIAEYNAVESYAATPPLRMGMQSRMQPIKDHPTLLRGFRLLLDRNPGMNLQLEVAGDGETLPAIKSLAAELGVQDVVRFHGMLNGPALISMMESLNIYIHATMGETLSNSIMQAMACGLPVVASDVWGVNNMIQPGINGLLYEPGNAEDLAAKLDQLVKHPAQQEALGKTARKFAEDNYDNGVMFRLYKQLY